jgi:hypothetical protein
VRIMIDTQALKRELQQARQARMEAEDAGNELEELVWHMQHHTPSGPRVAYAFDGFGRPLADWSH